MNGAGGRVISETFPITQRIIFLRACSARTKSETKAKDLCLE